MGALSVVATRPDLIQQCVPQKTLNEWGVYEFRFFKHGQWKSVFVDDYLPLNEGQQIFSRCKDENEVWVSLMEKAYAKLHLCMHIECYKVIAKVMKILMEEQKVMHLST